MVGLTKQYFSALSKVLNVPLGKISTSDLSLPSRTANNKTTNGAINIILNLLKESKINNLEGKNTKENIDIRQWLEYIIVYATHVENKSATQQLFKELNNTLSTKTYLVAHRLTIADVVLYLVLFNVLNTLQNSEKEKYINISRWFDNLQQESVVRQNNQLVDFSTIYLLNTSVSTH